MNTKMLLKEFKKGLAREERAMHFYDHFSEHVDDEEVKKILTSIRDDEKKHMDISGNVFCFYSC